MFLRCIAIIRIDDVINYRNVLYVKNVTNNEMLNLNKMLLIYKINTDWHTYMNKKKTNKQVPIIHIMLILYAIYVYIKFYVKLFYFLIDRSQFLFIWNYIRVCMYSYRHKYVWSYRHTYDCTLWNIYVTIKWSC